ncbi:MAG: response regulator [Acidobacteria bacterium]|nr:MAG: response regulator [Acidobacteriota bacterium]
MQGAPEILVVDDNPADAVLVRESLAETSHQSHIYSVTDATEALAYLRRQRKYQMTARPDLVILDLNLVHRDGHKFLTVIKSDSGLRQIPVVVFSSSESLSDITRSYLLGANCYVSKPADLKRYFSAVRAIEEFWFGYASLPKKENDERSSCARIAD